MIILLLSAFDFDRRSFGLSNDYFASRISRFVEYMWNFCTVSVVRNINACEQYEWKKTKIQRKNVSKPDKSEYEKSEYEKSEYEKKYSWYQIKKSHKDLNNSSGVQLPEGTTPRSS